MSIALQYVALLRHQRHLFSHFPLDLLLIIFDFKASPYLGETFNMSNEADRKRSNCSYFNATFHWRDSEVYSKFCKSILLFLNETQKMQRYYVDAVNTTKDHTSWAANCDLRAMYKLDFINPILLRKSRLAFRYDCAPSNICGMFFYFII